MNHTARPLTKFEGGLQLFHNVDDDALNWLKQVIFYWTKTNKKLIYR